VTSVAHPHLPEVPRPLGTDEIAFLVSRLPGGSDPFAAAALCLPSNTLPDASWTRHDNGVLWRGAALHLDDADDPETLHDWVSSVWRHDDVVPVPTGPVHRWVRAVRSGTGWVLWGPPQLWDGPSITATADVAADALYGLADDAWYGRVTGPPALLVDRGMLVDGSPTAWRVSSLDTAVFDITVFDTAGAISAFCEHTAERTGAHGWRLDKPRTREPRWVLTLVGSRHDMRVPIIRRGSVLSAGVPAGPSSPGIAPDAGELDPGWKLASMSGGRCIIAHRSGLYALRVPKRTQPTWQSAPTLR
jgi:hypothetical protein